MLGKVLQGGPGGLLGRGVVNVLHIGGKCFFVLPDHIPTGISHLVYHTYLGPGFREHVLDGVRKPIKIVGGRNKDVLGATSSDIGQYAHPESGRFVLAQPKSHHFFLAIPAKPHCNINGLVDDLGALAYQQREIAELKKKLRNAELERDILKKAIAIFS